jgi:hypothetical protein
LQQLESIKLQITNALKNKKNGSWNRAVLERIRSVSAQ